METPDPHQGRGFLAFLARLHHLETLMPRLHGLHNSPILRDAQRALDIGLATGIFAR
jgi:hypothetical protein